MDTVFVFAASHTVRPNHLLQRRLWIAITGITRITIAGKVRVIIGMPMSASHRSAAVVSLMVPMLPNKNEAQEEAAGGRIFNRFSMGFAPKTG